MQTIDNIKKGLACHALCRLDNLPCSDCAYHGPGLPPCGKAVHEDAIAMLEQLQAQVPKWISVEDPRKPKHLEEVLCRYVFDGCEDSYQAVLTFYADGDNGYVTGPHFTDEGKWDMRVTHWMPLPEEPKEDDHAQK